MFVSNAWYMAAWARDVGRETLLSRTLLGQRIVFYRKENGEPVALRDLCPHRFVPLHAGKLKGDVLECGYHGLQFGTSGACVHNPHGDGKISSAMTVRNYPVADIDGVIWIWMGEPARANPAEIHRFPFLTDTASYAVVDGEMLVKANYQLINDNLLDLSHTQYVHPMFQHDKAVVQEVEETSGRDGFTLWNRMIRRNVAPNVFLRMFDHRPVVDNWVDTSWHGPSVIHLDIGSTAPGESRDAPGAVKTPSLHFLTPETESTTHYFWAVARNVRIDDAAVSQGMRQGISHAFNNEDKPLIEMQQAELGGADLMSMKPVLLKTDANAVQARRTVTQMQESEAPQAAGA